MARRLRFFRDTLLPAVLLVALLMLLTGCLWFSTSVRPDGSGRDFRNYVGDGRDNKPIVKGKIDRAGVEAILGAPGRYVPLEKPGHVYAEYYFDESRGVAVGVIFFPLCWGANWETGHSHRLRLYYQGDKLIDAVIDEKTSPTTFTQQKWGL